MWRVSVYYYIHTLWLPELSDLDYSSSVIKSRLGWPPSDVSLSTAQAGGVRGNLMNLDASPQQHKFNTKICYFYKIMTVML